MSAFPFKAVYWKCKCKALMPKRTLKNMLFDPVEYLKCLECGFEYDGDEDRIGEGPVKWLWECKGCKGNVSWKDDVCHNPDCGRLWLVDRTPKHDGGVPSYYGPKYDEPTQKELDDRANGKPHRPLPGCPEICKYQHVFELKLVPERLVGCARDVLPVNADLRPPIVPTEPKGKLRWTIVDGQGVATLPGGATTHETHGADTRIQLEPVAPKPSKFPGGTVHLLCEWHFGGPNDVLHRAEARLPWHEGVTPDCPTSCPDIPLDDVELEVRAFMGDVGAWRDVTQGPCCPGEDLELQVRLSPPVPADVTWTLLDAKGKPLAGDGGPAFLGVGLFGGKSATFEGTHEDTVKLRHARGAWDVTGQKAPVEVTLGSPLERGWIVTYDVAPAKLRVTVTSLGKSKQVTVDLRWHQVMLTVEGAWFSTGDAPGEMQLRTVAHLEGKDAKHEGVYVSVPAGHQLGTPFCADLIEKYAWKGHVKHFEGSASEPCPAASNCLRGRWAAGFVQAHGAHERWWKYERYEDQTGGARWLKQVAELPPMPLCDSRAGAPKPWHERPAILQSPQSTAPDSAYGAPAVEPVADAPWAHMAWRAEHEGRDYALRQVTVDDSFQTWLAVGLQHQQAGAWRELAPLATLRWRVRLQAGVTRTPGPDLDNATKHQTAPVMSSSVSTSIEGLLDRPVSNDAERIVPYASDFEPDGPEPGLQDVRAVELTLEAGGASSASHDDEVSTGEPLDEQLCFAPGVDEVQVHFTVDAPPGVTPAARLELRPQAGGALLWSHDLTADDLAAGTLAWDGEVDPGETFPGGYVTLERSPYELRLVLPDVVGPGRSVWTQFRIVAEGLELAVAPKETIKNDRVHGQLRTAPGGVDARGAASPIKLFLPGDVFRAADGEMDADEGFKAYGAIVKDDIDVPLVATLRLRSAEGKAVEAPRGVGRVRVVWDVEDAHADVIEPLSCATHPAGEAQTFVRALETFRSEQGEPPGENAHEKAGGKRAAGERLLQLPAGYPPQAALRAGVFPFAARALGGRPWAVETTTWPSGALAGRGGVLLRPSRMAGDAYRVTAVLVPDDAALAKLDAPGPLARAGLLHASTRELQLWRRVHVVGHERKRIGMAQDWDKLRAMLAAAYVGVVPPGAGDGKVWTKADYELRFGLAHARLENKAYRAATFPLGHFDAGEHAVKTRTYAEYEAAHAELLGLTPEEFQASAQRWQPGGGEDQFGGLCYSAASELAKEAFDDVLDDYGPGVVVLQWRKCETEDGTMLGRGPVTSSTTRQKAVLLMYADDFGTLVHELGHQMFLPHAPGAPGAVPSSHDRDDERCVMAYWSDADHLCGMCALRLRGWSKFGVLHMMDLA